MTKRSNTLNTDEHLDQDKVINVFKFLKGMNLLKAKTVLNVKDYRWRLWMEDVPEDADHILLANRNTAGDYEMSPELLSVQKPEHKLCPAPDEQLERWLEKEKDWRDFHLDEVKHVDQLPIVDKNGELIGFERFSDSPMLEKDFSKWQEKRRFWVTEQRKVEAIRHFFSDLYAQYRLLEDDSEANELIVANGFIVDRQKPDIVHPVLTQRVKIDFDADSNTLTVLDDDYPTQLESEIFAAIEDINDSSLSGFSDQLAQEELHPFDRHEIPDFLKQLCNSISDKAHYIDGPLPEGWEKTERLVIYWCPCFIIRKRRSGAVQAIEHVISHIESTGEISQTFLDIVTTGSKKNPVLVGEEPRSEEPSIEERLAAVGGESVDIILPKEANREQLEIAKRIERNNAVVVQGPPGTGKTHTIANLIGHFLAQGKTVLVTSEKAKALTVLKEKLPTDLQSLCLTVTGDKQALEESVRRILNIMDRDSAETHKLNMERANKQRLAVSQELARVRQQLFQIIAQEASTIVLNGESISPTNAARFVCDHATDFENVIPGTIDATSPLPLSTAEFDELYRTNVELTLDDETEMTAGLPSPESLPTPEALAEALRQETEAKKRLSDASNVSQLVFEDRTPEGNLIFRLASEPITINGEALVETFPELKQKVQEELDYAHDLWMLTCGTDGKNPNRRALWLNLVNKITETVDAYDRLELPSFGKTIAISLSSPEFEVAVSELKDHLGSHQGVSWFSGFMNKRLKMAQSGATINGEPLKTVEDCELILSTIKLNRLRAECAFLWDELIHKKGGQAFSDLAKGDEPSEKRAAKWIEKIDHWVLWYEKNVSAIRTLLESMGVPFSSVIPIDENDTDFDITVTLYEGICKKLPALIWTIEATQDVHNANTTLSDLITKVVTVADSDATICEALRDGAQQGHVEQYREAMQTLMAVSARSTLLEKRNRYLHRLEKAAPEWATAIRERRGEFGKGTVSFNVAEAWKWRQYNEALNQLNEHSYQELQQKATNYGRQFRELTAEYAKFAAWYALRRKTEKQTGLRRTLEQWTQTVRKIGKGTGKSAGKLRAEARKLMIQCQRVVPVWVMPMATALESLTPGENTFDVVIVDEASQSDISALAILYLGKKLIIVGDDAQVSPMGAGQDKEKLESLTKQYLQDISGHHLYDWTTSIYDLTKQTFDPVMLLEHFRCVPDIIGYSNQLSYKGNIKPLREPGLNALEPAVINYRVEGVCEPGKKTNLVEAQTIVALIKACSEQSEYNNKTFGVISLLGDDQVALIQSLILSHFTEPELKRRQITVGNSATFQGDERDVIFLSMVASPRPEGGPLRKMTEGSEDSAKKRYNVAASRARDQLWVVNSLDPTVDLKPDDLRFGLLTYATNPKAYRDRTDKVEKKAESPFEVAVAKALVSRNYHIEQQWEVGAYRLDMVVMCGEKKIAIECDGEQFHSGEDKIREDMERQTILERIGWRFIRIRGSEYYRNPDACIERVVAQLNEAEIYPETSSVAVSSKPQESELLQRVKAACADYLAKIVVKSTVDNEAYLVEREVQALATTAGTVNTAPSGSTAAQPVSAESASSGDSAQGNLFLDKNEAETDSVEAIPAKPKRKRTTSGTTRKRVKREKEE